MSNGYYSHQTHIFDNPYSNEVYIGVPTGKTLNINGNTSIGPGSTDRTIQFNDAGEFGGSVSCKFVEDTIIVPNVSGSVDTDSLGYNEIYRGSAPQVIGPSSDSWASQNFGTTVSVNTDRLFAACPYFEFGGSLGAMSVFDVNDAVFVENTSFNFRMGGFTLEAQTRWCDSDPTDNNWALLGQADEKIGITGGSISIFKCTAGTWSRYQTLTGVMMGRLYDGVLLTVNYYGKFCTYVNDGSSFVLQQVLIDLATAENQNTVPMRLRNNKAVFAYNGALYVFTYSAGTWTVTNAITLGVLDMDLSNYFAVIDSSGSLKVYENFAIIQTISGLGLTNVCTHGDYIFTYGSNTIRIFKRSGSTFFESTNSTVVVGIESMSTDGSYLVVGRPSANNGFVYKIESYTNITTNINRIELADSGALVIDPETKLVVTKDTEVLGTLSAESVEVSADTGFYSVAGNITAKCNSVDKFSINSTSVNSSVPIFVPTGSVTAPNYTFTGDTNTGIYRIGADNLGITCNGVKQLDISTARTSVTNQFMAPLSSATVPGYALGSSNTGMYAFGASIGFTISSTAQMTIDGTHVVSIPPFRQLGNGSVSSPSFSWTGATNSGMYYTTNAINFAIAGTKNFQINPGGNININSIIGLTTPSTTLGMGAAIEFGLGGVYKLRMGPVGSFLTSVSIGDNGCPLSSLNGSGSNLRVTTNGSGKAGLELINTGGATEFQLFISNTTSVGSITTNGSSTSYNTSSDYRLKENVAPLANQLDRIDLLNPVSFDWKNSSNKGEGFLAHELQLVYPEAVKGEKDDVDSEGNARYQSVDTSFLIGSLVACIKELKEEIRLIKLSL